MNPCEKPKQLAALAPSTCWAPSSFLKEDDIRLAKQWAENQCIPWKTGDGWRSVACRLAHEVEGLRGRLAEQAMMERRYQKEIRRLRDTMREAFDAAPDEAGGLGGERLMRWMRALTDMKCEGHNSALPNDQAERHGGNVANNQSTP